MIKMRVWWIPQIPMKPFKVDVRSVQEGVKIMDVLSDYDCFQLDNNVKPEYCNTGGLEVFDEQESEWLSWDVEDELLGYFDDPREYLQQMELLK